MNSLEGKIILAFIQVYSIFKFVTLKELYQQKNYQIFSMKMIYEIWCLVSYLQEISSDLKSWVILYNLETIHIKG